MSVPYYLAAETEPSQLGGLTGWVASVIESLGELGVGLLVALENLIPPIPSEIVLSMAGYLASSGRVNLVLVGIAATAGSVLGALALYWLGYALGGSSGTRRARSSSAGWLPWSAAWCPSRPAPTT